MNVIFISPFFPSVYYQFLRAVKYKGMNALGIGEEDYDSLNDEQKDSLSDYYRVDSLEDYDEVYRAVAYFSFKYGKIDHLESNNEYWLSNDARLRTDFNICSNYKLDDLENFKLKSSMKKFYKKANVPVARYHIVNDIDSCLKFIEEVKYPVIVKPNNGVGASDTHKIDNLKELKNFFKNKKDYEYIMEEFIDGDIVSFDGIVNNESKIIFETSHVFTSNIMNIVNETKECIYYSVKVIPFDLRDYGHRVIKAFKPRNRFFHLEFFRLRNDKEGLGKKNDLVGLEVNMRPPGGYTTDMMNYSKDIDVYSIYADILQNNHSDYKILNNYYCIHIGRRDNLDYLHDADSINEEYEDNLLMYGEMPVVLSDALGNEYFVLRFDNMFDMVNCINFILEKR